MNTKNETPNYNYNLDFYQALKLMIDEKQYMRGNGFKKGFYIKISKSGNLMLVDVNNFSKQHPFYGLSLLAGQKFREITVATLEELSK